MTWLQRNTNNNNIIIQNSAKNSKNDFVSNGLFAFFHGLKKSISDLLILLSSDILVLDFTKTLKTKKNMDDNLSLKMMIYFL